MPELYFFIILGFVVLCLGWNLYDIFWVKTSRTTFDAEVNKFNKMIAERSKKIQQQESLIQNILNLREETPIEAYNPVDQKVQEEIKVAKISYKNGFRLMRSKLNNEQDKHWASGILPNDKKTIVKIILRLQTYILPKVYYSNQTDWSGTSIFLAESTTKMNHVRSITDLTFMKEDQSIAFYGVYPNAFNRPLNLKGEITKLTEHLKVNEEVTVIYDPVKHLVSFESNVFHMYQNVLEEDYRIVVGIRGFGQVLDVEFEYQEI